MIQPLSSHVGCEQFKAQRECIGFESMVGSTAESVLVTLCKLLGKGESLSGIHYL